MADANKYAPILSKAQQKGPLAIGLILVIVIISIVVSVLILPSFNDDTPKPAAPIKPASTPAPAPQPKPAAPPQPPPQPLRETPAKPAPVVKPEPPPLPNVRWSELNREISSLESTRQTISAYLSRSVPPSAVVREGEAVDIAKNRANIDLPPKEENDEIRAENSGAGLVTPPPEVNWSQLMQSLVNLEEQREKVLNTTLRLTGVAPKVAEAKSEHLFMQSNLGSGQRLEIAKHEAVKVLPKDEYEVPLPPSSTAVMGKMVSGGYQITLIAAMFDPETAEILPAYADVVTKILDVLQQDPQRRVLITGYTDKLGNAAQNRALSRRWAEALRNTLIFHGVQGKRIKVQGKGSSEARRLEVLVLN